MFIKGSISAECLRQAGVLDIWFDAVYVEPVLEETLNGSTNSCKIYMRKGRVEADGIEIGVEEYRKALAQLGWTEGLISQLPILK